VGHNRVLYFGEQGPASRGQLPDAPHRAGHIGVVRAPLQALVPCHFALPRDGTGQVTVELPVAQVRFHLQWPVGAERLRAPVADPRTPGPETRNPALLKLTFADLGPRRQVARPAEAQAAKHRRWRDTCIELRSRLDPDAPDTPARTRLLTLGSAQEKSYVGFWETLAAAPDAPYEAVFVFVGRRPREIERRFVRFMTPSGHEPRAATAVPRPS
jgi:hypothetical protein